MFSGLVLGRGRVKTDPEPAPGGGARLRVTVPDDLAARLSVGASLAVAGVCLTVVEPIEDGTALFEVSPETLRRTTLSELRLGSEVNLEPALRLGDALGGHWVQGHVDGVGEVVSIAPLGEHREVRFNLPEDLRASVVEKGSITVDGVSLTVVDAFDDGFTVPVIPHTCEVTTLGTRQPGDEVNLEVDVTAKYVERLLAWKDQS